MRIGKEHVAMWFPIIQRFWKICSKCKLSAIYELSRVFIFVGGVQNCGGFIAVTIILLHPQVDFVHQLTKAKIVLDSQNFLVRHRRNRVYGAAIVNTGTQSEEVYQKVFCETLQSLQTHCQFSMSETFADLPPGELKTERQRNVLVQSVDNALKDSRLDMFSIVTYSDSL